MWQPISKITPMTLTFIYALPTLNLADLYMQYDMAVCDFWGYNLKDIIALSFLFLDHSLWGSQQPYHEESQAVLWRCPHGKKLKPLPTASTSMPTTRVSQLAMNPPVPLKPLMTTRQAVVLSQIHETPQARISYISYPCISKHRNYMI